MKSIYKISWRNLWRNKRRTIITASSIVIAVILAIVTRSMQEGSYKNMINNSVKLSTGHIQIHKKGFWEKKSIEKTFYDNSKLVKRLKEYHPQFLIPRLSSFALCSAGKHTKGVFVSGIVPSIESKVYNIKKRLIKGEFISDDGNGILLGDKLASFLNVDVGDSVVLLGQGYHGVTAAGLYPVKGIFHLPSKEINSSMIYLSLKTAQNLYYAPSRLTSYSLIFNNSENLSERAEKIKKSIGNNYEVMTWMEMSPEIVQVIETDRSGGIFMLGIIYVIIGFGIFGTLLMMTLERRKEFAIMIAVGLRRGRLRLILFWETVYLSILSAFSGIILALPIVYYFHISPIKLTGETAKMMEDYGADPFMPFALRSDIFLYQALVVLILALIAAIYPIVKVNKLNILKAMRD